MPAGYTRKNYTTDSNPNDRVSPLILQFTTTNFPILIVLDTLQPRFSQ